MGQRQIIVSVTVLSVTLFFITYVYVVFTKRHAALMPFKPQQIHISFGDKSNDIVLTWSTKEDPNGTMAFYSLCRGPRIKQVSGTRTKLVDDGHLESTQFIHRVVFKDLNFNTSYRYRVGSPQSWSGALFFKTPPAGEKWTVKALVFGGLGLENGVTLPYMMRDVLEAQDYNLIIHAGDTGLNMSKDNGTAGDRFMNEIQPLAAKVPYMVCPGNLEEVSDYFHYKKRFTMPGHNKYQNMFYSFNLGSVHFVSINTEAYYNKSKFYSDNGTNTVVNQIRTQYEWLKRDLAEANKTANRDVRPWIILYGHRPMLCSNSLPVDRCMERGYEFPHRVGNSSYGGFGLEELLKDYGVDLSIWAHQHSYERLWPVYNKTVYNGSRERPYVNPRAPVHVTTGAAGNKGRSEDFVDDPPAWSAFRSSALGYSRLSVRNGTHLFFEQLAVKNNIKTIDSFWLVREKHTRYVI